MPGRVEGKVALVTGAARGQGRSHALRLAEEGADVIAVDLCQAVPGTPYPGATPDDLAETVKEVEALDRRIVAREVDVRDRAAFAAAVDAGVAELGRLDIVVGNAGVCLPARWDQVSEENWDTTLDINAKGVWHTVLVSAPHLIAAGGGSIVLTSSSAGLKAAPFMVPYVASKFAVTGMTKAFAAELGKHRIRVNSVHPTGVDTPMAAGDTMSVINALIEDNPRLGAVMGNMFPVDSVEARDISNAVLFLASDEARYVTAAAYAVDAGLTQM
jgi:SDR family mycofactocin-dependent oxidoreductase